MWPGGEDLVPPELLQTREWLHEMFREAGKGLPWPHQMSLMLIEQAITLGMFGGLLATLWSLRELQSPPGAARPPGPLDLAAFLAQLEQTARGGLPAHVHDAIRHVQGYLNHGPFDPPTSAVWQQWRGGMPPR